MKLLAIETDIDDMDMRLFSHVQDKLLKAGAHQAVMLPVYGKKGRPAVRLQALAMPKDAEAIKEIFYRETSTLGVRTYKVECQGLKTKIIQAATDFGLVPVKIGIYKGKAVNIQPEYEPCKLAAEQAGVPLKNLLEQAKASALSLMEQEKGILG